MMYNKTFGSPPKPKKASKAEPKKNSKKSEIKTPNKDEGPKRTLRITALGPSASDRNVIPVEMKEEEALKFESAKKEIDSKLKKAGLKMKTNMYWIDGIHRVSMPSYCDWPWHLKHFNYNLYCDCDRIPKD